MASSFFAKIINQNRMDRAYGGFQTSGAAGSGIEDIGASLDFKAVYNKVASMNAEARRITSANTVLEERNKITEYQDRINDAAAYGNYAIDPADHFGNVSSRVDKTDRAADRSEDEDRHDPVHHANRVISKALTAISDKLHLSIDPDLKQLSISTVSKETVQQLSEIMAALKNIAGLIDGAVANNQKLDLGNQVLDVSQLRELGAFVQSQMFKIELGIGMLGAGDQVRETLSQLNGNIPQTLDPAQLSMSQVHAQKVFGDIFNEPATNLKALVEKIRELCAEYGQSGQVNLNIVSNSGSAAKDGPAYMFDGAVMRALLKIDGKDSVSSENIASAVKNEKLNLVSASTVLFAKDGTAIKEAMGQIPLVDGSAKGGFLPTITGLENRTQGTIYRTIEESVMRQLADKLHMAYRTGVNEIRIQLRPDTMGEVKIRIRVEGDVVFAKIQVENQQIKQIVENNMQFLKDSLSQQHLQAGSLDVNVGSDGMGPKDGAEVYDEGNGSQVSGSDQAAGQNSGTETATAISIGSETGRRFGNNSVEYFL